MEICDKHNIYTLCREFWNALYGGILYRVLAATPGDVGLATHEEMTPVNCGDIPNKNGHI